jgi:hypothetical protein
MRVTRGGKWGAAALVLLAAGCRPAWPVREPVSTAHALIKSVRDRREALETLYSPDTRMRYGWKPARADIYLGEEDRFRLDVKHPFGTDKLYTVIVNDGSFLYVDHRKKTGGTGEVAELIATRLPELDPAPDAATGWQLFLPTLEEKSSESVALAKVGGSYVLEYWEPDRMPSRQVWVDASSHVPVRELFYVRDGRVAVEFNWKRLTWREEEKLVIPYQVDIRVPARKIKIRLILEKPQPGAEIKGVAFSLRRERRLLLKSGGEIKEIGPEPEKGAPGVEAGKAPRE